MADRVTVSVEVSKELHELLQGIIKLVVDLKPVLKDGLQPSDIGAVVASVLAFTPSLKGVEALPAEVSLQPGESAMAGAVFASQLVKAIRTT